MLARNKRQTPQQPARIRASQRSNSTAKPKVVTLHDESRNNTEEPEPEPHNDNENGSTDNGISHRSSAGGLAGASADSFALLAPFPSAAEAA